MTANDAPSRARPPREVSTATSADPRRGSEGVRGGRRRASRADRRAASAPTATASRTRSRWRGSSASAARPIREALRVLTAQDLIRTAKGAGGGSYVQVPSVRHISDVLHSSINLLTAARPRDRRGAARGARAARGAGRPPRRERRATSDVDAAPRVRSATRRPKRRRRRSSSPTTPTSTRSSSHTCGNTLLAIAAQPVFNVLMSGFARSSLGTRFHQSVRRPAPRDRATRSTRATPTRPASLMHDHLEFLRPHYEKLWEQAKRKRER